MSNRLVSIIKQNNLPELRRFIASCSPEDVIAPGTPYLNDPLLDAASYGSPEAFHILSEMYTTAPEVAKKFNPKFRPLLSACGTANIDVMRFILDRHDPENRLPVGTVDLHQRDDSGDTPIIVAAGSLMYLDKDADEVEGDGLHWTEWIRDRIARGHHSLRIHRRLYAQGPRRADVILLNARRPRRRRLASRQTDKP
ncbi:uncharacterized protein N7498_008956 [Penicillium cinerascens]|uniref:Uncharacterized protein n=1 Tax=Penicillium cinerascens TaxID=70096 RepID=A0A9W9MB57_9EURO|nr:uncharacterized protein N7498_008956 [Penicillium cinerascens]KAJ5195518.1 hypothetical protein N7498_008956 [Penicillium cinerascens]